MHWQTKSERNVIACANRWDRLSIRRLPRRRISAIRFWTVWSSARRCCRMHKNSAFWLLTLMWPRCWGASRHSRKTASFHRRVTKRSCARTDVRLRSSRTNCVRNSCSKRWPARSRWPAFLRGRCLRSLGAWLPSNAKFRGWTSRPPRSRAQSGSSLPISSDTTKQTRLNLPNRSRSAPSMPSLIRRRLPRALR